VIGPIDRQHDVARYLAQHSRSIACRSGRGTLAAGFVTVTSTALDTPANALHIGPIVAPPDQLEHIAMLAAYRPVDRGARTPAIEAAMIDVFGQLWQMNTPLASRTPRGQLR